MKKLKVILVILTFIVGVASCRKSDIVPMPKIDLGTKSTSTGIKTITQTGNTVIAQFETTVGAKYSVQIIPFGSEEPVKKEGFTANDDITTKTYDLSTLPKKDYDLLFIDVEGKEVKFPLTIK